MTQKAPKKKRWQISAASVHPPARPDFASKANDLDALRSAVVDAATVSAGLWLSYLFVLLYLAIAAGSVTHRDLLFEKSVKLPFLNVELPLVACFVVGPGLFLIVHAYVMLHFMLLADKAGAFHVQLRSQINDEDIRSRLRRQLPSNIFVQYVAGPPEVRSGTIGLMFRSIADISLVFLPIALLLLFQLQFLPYHSEAVTWWQRVAILIDLVLIWMLWPSIARGGISQRGGLNSRSKRYVMASAIGTVLTVGLAFGVATFPGEWLNTRLPSIPIIPTHQPWYEIWEYSPLRKVPEKDAGNLERLRFAVEAMNFKSLHVLLVAGDVDPVTRKPKSLWSNRIVLPELDATNLSNETLALRGRRLEGAVFVAARLRSIDFTGAHLRDAKLDGADLSGALFGCGGAALKAKTDEAPLRGPLPRKRYEGDDCVELQGASLKNALLQGAVMDNAALQGTDLELARLHGASMDDAKLDGASLVRAELQGATLDRASLIGVDLSQAKMYGTVLDHADLSAANLYRTELQGAQLFTATVEGAEFSNVFVWRAIPPAATLREMPIVSVFRPMLNPVYEERGSGACEGVPDGCKWTLKKFEALKELLRGNISDQKRRDDALRRVAYLDPSISEKEFPESRDWKKLEKASPDDVEIRKAQVKQLRLAGCDGGGADLIRGLLWRRKNVSELDELAAEFLDEKKCPEARDLLREDRRELEAIKESANYKASMKREREKSDSN